MIADEIVLALISITGALGIAWVVLWPVRALLQFRKEERDEEARKSQTVKPVCGCGHHYAYHDLETGQCSEFQGGVVTVNNQTGWKSLMQCKCRHYTGPHPLPEYYAPELSDE